MNCVAIIPARGGSKRIPRKNIKEFCGKPMIAWSIEAALDSKCFDQIIVSTDDHEIAEVATRYGATVPFFRPKELSDDFTPTRPVINHAIQELEKEFGIPEFVCTIYAAAPLIDPLDIRKGLDILIANNANFSFSVTSFPYPIQRALRVNAENRVSMFYPQYRKARSQDLEHAYHDAGQFYWGRARAYLTNIEMFADTSTPVILPNWRVVDIDNQEDWERAELIFNYIRS